jgi:hypothetical protein
MPLLLKVLPPALLTVITAITLFRDWRFNERRTRGYNLFTIALLCAFGVAIVLLIVSLKGEYGDSTRTQDKIDSIVTGKDDILDENKKLRSEIASYQGQIADYQYQISVMKERTDSLLAEAGTLNAKNSTLLAEITKYQSDLKSRDERIQQLERQAKMASQGITSTYDFNGAKRDASPGKMNVIVGEEYSVFQRLIELERNRNFNEIIAVCKRQIKKTPDWLTPYLFLGTAYLNLGDKAAAIANLQHVANNAPGNQDYARATELLRQLQTQ